MDDQMHNTTLRKLKPEDDLQIIWHVNIQAHVVNEYKEKFWQGKDNYVALNLNCVIQIVTGINMLIFNSPAKLETSEPFCNMS